MENVLSTDQDGLAKARPATIIGKDGAHEAAQSIRSGGPDWSPISPICSAERACLVCSDTQTGWVRSNARRNR